MPKTIFLDSAPVGLLAHPARSPIVIEISRWALECQDAGHTIVLPEIVDYEVRRELIRVRQTTTISELDGLRQQFVFQPVTSVALTKAAELWASTRQAGRPTSHDENIDIDIILAAQAITFGVEPDDFVIATVNTRHLSLFVNADIWQNIEP